MRRRGQRGSRAWRDALVNGGAASYPPISVAYRSPGGTDDFAEATTALAASLIWNGASPTGPFSVGLWCRISSGHDGGILYTPFGDGPLFDFHYTGQFSVQFATDTVGGVFPDSTFEDVPPGTMEFAPGTWHRIALVFGVSSGAVYIDGLRSETWGGALQFVDVEGNQVLESRSWGQLSAAATVLRAFAWGSGVQADLANILIDAREHTDAEELALAEAGVSHNHRNPFGAWPGQLVTVAWDGNAIDGVVPNSGSGAACGFALGGECTTIAL